MYKGKVWHDRTYKRRFDLTILLVSHLVLGVLLLVFWTVIPLMIWMWDRGPIFYRQKRVGFGGRIFTTIKFRTMVPNADQMGNPWTSHSDPRLTPLGRFLRKTALDELPQVLSIWKGDMTLVGPRALAVREHQVLESAIPGFQGRLAVRPGLTGLAQIYDRSDDAGAKLTYDLEYIKRMGLLLDLKILILSVLNTVGGRWDRRDGKSSMPTTATSRDRIKDQASP